MPPNFSAVFPIIVFIFATLLYIPGCTSITGVLITDFCCNSDLMSASDLENTERLFANSLLKCPSEICFHPACTGFPDLFNGVNSVAPLAKLIRDISGFVYVIPRNLTGVYFISTSTIPFLKTFLRSLGLIFLILETRLEIILPPFAVDFTAVPAPPPNIT